jgi:hypothetical protein
VTAPAQLPLAEHTFRTWRSDLVLSPRAQNGYRDIGRLHQFVLYGFRPPHMVTAAPTDPPPHVLYAAARPAARRAASGHNIARPPQRLLIQSPVRPDWQDLLGDGRLTAARITPLTQNYRAGDIVDLRVIANPTHKERGKNRRPLSSAAECGAWLRRRLADHGVDIPADHVLIGEGQRLTGSSSRGHPLTVVTRALRARGTVRDPEAFTKILTIGLGAAKPYGCGMLVADLVPSQPDDTTCSEPLNSDC